MKRKKIDRAKVADCAKRGLTMAEAAAFLGCVRGTVCHIAEIEGLRFRPARGPGRRRKRYNQIVSAIRDGVNTSAAIATKIGVTRNLVSVSLYLLAEESGVVRGPRRAGKTGRASIEWRLPEAAQ